MKVLVACEESQIVTEQFIIRGHNAMSCDIAYDGAKGLPHYRGDVRDLLTEYYDLVIFHPVCKYQANSGVQHLYKELYRWPKLILGCEFFNLRHQFNAPMVCTENPIPHRYAVKHIGMYDQIIQPWQFGHKQMKATCFWLKNLPQLRHTNVVGPPPKDKQERKKWQDVWRCPPGPQREMLRSRTFTGVAAAMAQQWGSLTSEYKNNLFDL